ncbi:ATP-binding cassette domain-containing protein [Portibacter lacus]|uniref:ABC transporter domain-containing protein n=1 Tax=Portibacter lacus TaxID=1099794 RepID=A0AA37SRB5_9BACT|nr:ATP-binding cassette domain-containing protein [Portibacter lacus]GLR16400.1 hypothetical protein GCM10007940_10150 [Portibacter lacus]
MIELRDISIQQGNFLLSDINFSIEKGEYVVLMGKTGSGKTTIIEAICGLRSISGGQILVNGSDYTQLAPGDRGVGYVPQDGAVFSHMSVRENIQFALKLRKWNATEMKEQCEQLAKILSISHLLDRMPEGLSGGEIQRVALARALSFKPDFLCLDEPVSALDEETKENLYLLFEDLKKSMNITILHISHSTAEAKRLADRIIVLEDGKIRPY